MFPALVLSCAFLIELPGQSNEPPPYAKPVSATKARYIEVIENNTHLIYPGIAIIVVTLIALGVISAWRTEDMDGIQKAEVKREIVRVLRQEIHGVTVERLSKMLGVPSLRLIRLLEEMQNQGITECRTDTRRHTTWRLRGLTS